MAVPNFKKLLTKENPTGEELGRLMIADLVVAYENAQEGIRDKGLLTQDDRENLIRRLRDQSERRTYNDYVGIYELIKNYGSICQAMATSVELQFWRVYSVLVPMLQAEVSYGDSTYEPVIMTRKECEEKRDRLDSCRGGVAVLLDSPPCPKGKVDERGWFIREDDARAKYLKNNMAESILENFGETIINALESLSVAARVYFSHAAGMQLIGETIKVPITAPLVYPFPTEKIEALNKSMLYAHEVAERYEIEDPEKRSRHESVLNARLREVFSLVDLDALKPDEETVSRVRKQLTPMCLRELKLSEELTRR